MTMPERQHIEGREACPFLPPAAEIMRPSDTRAQREGDDPDAYYLATLECAQSLWLQGKPAQALLQLNHALGVAIPPDSEALIQWPLPYQAKVWIFTRRHEEGFMGNPVRHYQHLASRMSGPNKQLRSWRAWACFHLAENVLPSDEFPRDERQIEREGLEIPCWEKVLTELGNHSGPMEVQILAALAG
jgi:hypothetical protein